MGRDLKKDADHILHEESNSDSISNLFVSQMAAATMHSGEIFGSYFIKVSKIQK